MGSRKLCIILIR